MFYRIAIVGFLLITLMSCAQSSKFNAKASWQDFVQVVEDNYAYLDTAPVDWPALKQHYSKQAIAIQSEEEFVDFRTKRDAQLAMPKLIIPSIQVNMNAGKMPAPDTDGDVYLKVPINKL